MDILNNIIGNKEKRNTEISKFIKSFYLNLSIYEELFPKINSKLLQFLINCEFNILDCWNCIDIVNIENKRMFPILYKYLNDIHLNVLTKTGTYIELVILLIHFINEFYNKEGKRLINYLVYSMSDFELMNHYILYINL